MVVQRERNEPWKGALRGQMMPLFALTMVVFIGALATGIDLSRLRTAAESAQRAVNAAALAGVVFLPDYQSNAYTRAQEEARKNGFTDGQNNVSVTPQRVSGYTGRLKVTITEQVPLIFGGLLGLGQQTLSRTATAEYDQPLQMGAPDYVLGYAPFPTSLVNGTSGQGFYLEARGPYGMQENGDAYSQYYESYSGATFSPASGASTYLYDPCTTSSSGPVSANHCQGLTANPDLAQWQQTNPNKQFYYDYVVYNPFANHPLIVKIFDPYDEGALNGATKGSSTTGSLEKLSLVAPYGNKFIDQWGCSNGGTHFCDQQTGGPSSPFPTALRFSLYGPYQTLADTSGSEISKTPATGSDTCAQDCVIAPDFVTGDDPAHVACATNSTCSPSTTTKYAYKFLNYAIIYGKGYYHIRVQTTASTDSYYSGKFGTGGNVFGLAACDASSNAVIGTPSDPSDQNKAVSDPYNSTGSGAIANYWNANACPNPNPANQYTTVNGSQVSYQSACSNSATAPPDGCVHIFANGRMAMYTNIAGGSYTSPSPSLVPLGYVPGDYAGKTLQIRLFDVGDVSGGCVSGVCNNTIQVLTPAGDLTHNAGDQVSTSANINNNGYPSNLAYTYSARPTDCGNSDPCVQGQGAGFKVQAETSAAATQVINVGGSTWNGSWLTIKVPLVLTGYSHTYNDMVNQYGGYWKMLYNIAGTGNDTTTWEISINGAPVHLVPNGS